MRARQRREHAGEARERLPPGPEDVGLPRVARRLERRHDARAHERRLADARWPGDSDERLIDEARRHARDVAAASEKAIGVLFLERDQAGIRALVGGELAAVAAGHQRLE